MSPSPTLVFAISLLGLYILLKVLKHKRMKALMPPGPPGMFIIGNVLQWPKEQAFRQLKKWGDTYGPIMSLNMAGQPVVVINSLKVANELFDRRSAIYNNRPRLIVVLELLLGRNNLAFMPYGHKWRRHRRAMQEALNTRDLSAYDPFQERAAVSLVSQLLEDKSGTWQKLCNRAIAASTTSVVYGNALAKNSLDDILNRIFEVVHRVSNATTKDRHLVEFIPSMLLLPDWIAKWKRDAKSFYGRYTALFEGFYEDARLNMHGADNELSFCYHLKTNESRLGLDTQESAWIAATFILAGVDSSTAAFSAFFLSMLKNPNVMHLAQAEIDAIVGRDRLPTLKDIDRLPYTYAIVHELLRWWSVTPLSIPHSTTEDDWYDGYLIPKGSTVIQNLWAIGHDPETFPEPDCFQPERFLDKDSDGSIRIKGSIPKSFAFGFGRRICPGASLAIRNLFIEVACVLWAFDISPFYDEKGEPVIPSETDCLDDGLVITPLPFPCTIRPRSQDVEETVKATIQMAS